MIRRLGLNATILVMSGTHFLVDGYGNFLAPLLPLLIPSLHMSLATAGAMAMCLQISGSISQLGFGPLADRWRPRVLLIGGPLLSIVVLSLVGLATTPLQLALVLVVGGLGSAAFHPSSAALVHRASGRHKNTAMGVHITGGSLGMAVAPLVVAPFAERYGLPWTPLLAAPGLLLLLAAIPNIPPVAPAHRAHRTGGFRALRPHALPLTLLYLIVTLRTLVSYCFATFIPVLLTRRGLTVSQAAAVAAAYLFAAGLGGLVGGPIADRLGARRVIMVSLVASVPFLVAAPMLSGWSFVVLVSIGGYLLQSTLPVNVTMAQTIAPVSAATVSSLMMGFAWGTGGLCVPLVGLLADRVGLEYALEAMALLPLMAAVLAWPLPRGRMSAASLARPDLVATETA